MVPGTIQTLPDDFASRLRARCRACGFTLVELMVTIAVAAVILAMAVPSFTRLLANSRQTSATNSLLNALEYARNSALRGGQSVMVCPIANPTDTSCSADWNTGWGVISAPAGGSSVLLVSGGLGARGVSVTASGGAVPLVFTARGLVTGLPLATGKDLFIFCDNRGSAYAHSLVVNAGGYIQTSQTPGSDPDGTALVCP